MAIKKENYSQGFRHGMATQKKINELLHLSPIWQEPQTLIKNTGSK
jgi:hypothetical protein